MAEVKTEPVKATRVDDIDVPDVPAGAFEYFRSRDRDHAGMIYTCPCGCGREGVLHFRPAEKPSWDWNGNLDAPTVTPSVHHTGHWHGYLTDGIWISC